MSRWSVAAFYRFARLKDPAALRGPILEFCQAHAVCGSILLAAEGINGTIAAPPQHLPVVMAEIARLTGLSDIDIKYSSAEEAPFLRLKVKLKAEIVTLGVPADPLQQVGTYVEPQDWNDLISDPEVLVIDTRNHFEVEIGSFARAVDPMTQSFSQFPEYVRQNLDPAKHRKVAMFCTGGIRCEKATAYMLEQGFPEVYHLKGGILNYLEKVPEADSLWHGGCYVFDQRVALGHGLAISGQEVCHGCRLPLAAEARHHPDFEEGVCCPSCAPALTAAQKASARERWRQVQLAAARGDRHLGPQPQRTGD